MRGPHHHCRSLRTVRFDTRRSSHWHGPGIGCENVGRLAPKEETRRAWKPPSSWAGRLSFNRRRAGGDETAPDRESTAFFPRGSGTSSMNILAPKVLIPCFLLVAGLSASAQESPTPWSPQRLRTVGAWPHSAAEGRIEPTKRGLVVGVADGRKFAIAAANGLTLPAHFGRVRVVVTERSGGATWFVRLYGALRQRGEDRTTSIAEAQDGTGEHVFEIDPRVRTLTEATTAVAAWRGGPARGRSLSSRTWPSCRRSPGLTAVHMSGPIPARRTSRPSSSMPNLPEPFKPTDWRAKARDFDKLVFDFQARGRYLPLVWLDNSRRQP